MKSIHTFLASPNRFLLLTGTHQYEKHVIAVSSLLNYRPLLRRVLFRANHASNFETFLAPLLTLTRKPKTGTPISIRTGQELYVDTINRSSWSSSPPEVDAAILYPIDSLSSRTGDECVQDLIRRKASKIMMISWTDNRDNSWVSQFRPVHVIFDAEEERPDYHERMLEIIPGTPPIETLPGLPEYAKATPPNYLIQILCRGNCGRTRWARLTEPFPGNTALRSGPMGQYRATCLVCGYEARDNYNWSR